MATNRRTSSLVSFSLRTGSDWVWAVSSWDLSLRLPSLFWLPSLQTFISYRFAARTYSSADYHLLLDEIERMYFPGLPMLPLT